MYVATCNTILPPRIFALVLTTIGDVNDKKALTSFEISAFKALSALMINDAGFALRSFACDPIEDSQRSRPGCSLL